MSDNSTLDLTSDGLPGDDENTYPNLPNEIYKEQTSYNILAILLSITALVTIGLSGYILFHNTPLDTTSLTLYILNIITTIIALIGAFKNSTIFMIFFILRTVFSLAPIIMAKVYNTISDEKRNFMWSVIAIDSTCLLLNLTMLFLS